MIRRSKPPLRRTMDQTTRTMRRAWLRHTDRLATDPDYRDTLIDVGVIIASTIIRHPILRLLETALALRRPTRNRSTAPEDRWDPNRGYQ